MRPDGIGRRALLALLLGGGAVAALAAGASLVCPGNACGAPAVHTAGLARLNAWADTRLDPAVAALTLVGLDRRAGSGGRVADLALAKVRVGARPRVPAAGAGRGHGTRAGGEVHGRKAAPRSVPRACRDAGGSELSKRARDAGDGICRRVAAAAGSAARFAAGGRRRCAGVRRRRLAPLPAGAFSGPTCCSAWLRLFCGSPHSAARRSGRGCCGERLAPRHRRIGISPAAQAAHGLLRPALRGALRLVLSPTSSCCRCWCWRRRSRSARGSTSC